MTKEQRVIWAKLARRFGGPVYPIFKNRLITGTPELVSVYLGGRGWKLVMGYAWGTWTYPGSDYVEDIQFPGRIQ